MTWILYSLLGAVFLAACNSVFRLNPWGMPLYVLITCTLPLTIGIQWGFASAMQGAPSFLAGWFVGTGFSVIAGLLFSVFMFGEQLHFLQGLGVALILGGAYCLIR